VIHYRWKKERGADGKGKNCGVVAESIRGALKSRGRCSLLSKNRSYCIHGKGEKAGERLEKRMYFCASLEGKT